MTETLLDAPLFRHTTDIEPRPLPRPIAQARAVLPDLVAGILALPESSLAQPWPWIGGSEEEIRYGAYRAMELIEQAEGHATRALRTASVDGGEAATIIASATAARWDLHGLLAPLTDADLDADPGGGEWPIRLVLGHIINAQRAYGWGSAWWQEAALPIGPDLPTQIPDPFWLPLPEEDKEECAGSMAHIRARLDEILDLTGERLAGTPDERLGHGARWSGFAIPVAHRLARCSTHLREHTIHLEKTLALLGRTPSEPERLTRLVLAAYGRAEQVVFGQPSTSAVNEAAQRIRDAVVEAHSVVIDAGRHA